MITRLTRTLLPLIFIVFTGAFGYQIIEGWPLFDALYMTVITLTTVGFREIHPLSFSGKVFTMALILVGIGNVAYVIQQFYLQFFHPLFESIDREKRVRKKVRKMKNHYIICGFGRIGRDVAQSLISAGKQVVIIDKELPKKEGMIDDRIPYVLGDASHDEVLIEAGIHNASGLVSSVKSEAENVFITLSARELNPKIFVISRFEEDATRGKLLKAGADRVINPYQIGSQKISQIILKPTINKILGKAHQEEELNLNFEELEILHGNPLIGQTLRTCGIRHEHNIIIVAIEQVDGNIITNPGPDYEFREHDRIVMIANNNELRSVFRKYNR